MNLSESEMRKIQEEEEYRASIREDLSPSSKQKLKKRGIGCLTAIIIFVVISIAVGFISSNTPHSPTVATRENFKASVNFTGTQFIITNLDDLDCENAKLQINGGSYSLDGYLLEVGTTYTVGAMQFTKSDGTRFNPIQIKPKSFNIYCSRINSSNALGGASWYGEFK